MTDTTVYETEQCESPQHAGSRWCVSVDEAGVCPACTAGEHDLAWALPRMAAGITRDRKSGRFASTRRI